MGYVENISKALGRPVGGHKEPRQIIVEALEEKGIVVAPTTISRLREGSTSGEKIAARTTAANFLSSRTVARKNHFYQEVTQAAIDLRTTQAPPNEHRYNSKASLLDLVADRLGLEVQGLRRCFRAMRVDVMMTELSERSGAISLLFLGPIEKYLYAYTSAGASHYPKVIQQIDENWNHRTADHLYRLLYQNAQATTLATWTPYEVEGLQAFYQYQEDLGSPLSLFDTLVLQTGIKNEPDGNLADDIRRWTGVKYDESVTFNHFNVLLYGRP